MFVNTAEEKLKMPLGNKMGYKIGETNLALYKAGRVTAKRVNKKSVTIAKKKNIGFY